MAFFLLPADFKLIRNLSFSSYFKRNIKLVELADIFINDLKIKRNDVLMVQADLNIFKLADSMTEDLIYLLKMLVGKGGTILMPMRRAKLSGRGSIDELFSQMPDTVSSLVNEEQFAVWGKMADYLTGINQGKTEEHGHPGLYDKLAFIKGKIIGIGVSMEDITAGSGLSGHFADNDSLEFTKKGITFLRVDTANLEK
jgi:aminoglycoside N3'-acetyltransferase